MALEICKMLTLSTAHLTPRTCNDFLPGAQSAIAFAKGDYGWFVWYGVRLGLL